MTHMKVTIKKPQAKCKWCGRTFTKQHNRQEYCSKKCSKEAKKEQNRNNQHKWYHRNKNKPFIHQRNQIGTRPIGQHRHEDEQKEYETIRKEIQRIGLTLIY